MPTPLDWGAQALCQQLLPLLPGLSVEVLATCTSTNSRLLERARGCSQTVHWQTGPTPTDPAPGRRATDTLPCLLVAEHQSQGRGRQGKVWQSAAGASLTFSLALSLNLADWSGLSLAVGLALADALDPPDPNPGPGHGPQPPALGLQRPAIGLKWPNDLLLLKAPPPGAAAPTLPGHKLGGILIETVQMGAQRMAVVGVGLNILPMPGHPPAHATPPAAALSWGYACLHDLHPGITAPAALARVAPALVRALLAFEREGFAPLQARFAARDVLAGRTVSATVAGAHSGLHAGAQSGAQTHAQTGQPTAPPLSQPVGQPARPQAGLADGVDHQGTLWLRVGDQRWPVSSGEVSLRLAAATAPVSPPGRPERHEGHEPQERQELQEGQEGQEGHDAEADPC